MAQKKEKFDSTYSRTFGITPSSYWLQCVYPRLSENYRHTLIVQAKDVADRIESQADRCELSWLERCFYYFHICTWLLMELENSLPSHGR
jgi:hypothetical protein